MDCRIMQHIKALHSCEFQVPLLQFQIPSIIEWIPPIVTNHGGTKQKKSRKAAKTQSTRNKL